MCINAQKVDLTRWTDEKKLATVESGFSSKTPTKNTFVVL